MSDLYRPDWPLVKISDFAEINIGGTPSRAAPQFWATKPEGSPWIAISDLKGKYVDDTKEYITNLGAKCSNVRLIEPFTTVMSFKLTVGRTAIITRPMYCNEAIAIFSSKSDALSGSWLYHALPRAALSVVTDNAVKGATLNKAKMAEMTVQLPPITEQSKIALILDTLDTTIRETEALIDKLKAVNQGLLHDLLTRGIDANGQLRPPKSEAPQLYKESQLGWIPREWEAVELSQLIDPKRPVVYGILMPGYGYTGGVPVVKVKDIYDGKIHLNDLLLTCPKIDREYSRSRLKTGDLLFTIRGTVGRTAFVPPALNSANITQDTARLAVVGTDARYLRAYLGMAVPRRFIATHTLGVAVQGINLRDVRRIPIALPSALEAKAIADEIQSQEQRLESESLSAAKVRRVKAGLMDDLLTGRVRVTPLLESMQPSSAPTEA
ncbi:restriction endonuclease subunit S [Pseudomonas corrugata]|uniref:Restriction endonuclease subunit S n=1 Tax=Pseudomonas corrugata TaxID=47879 RepID=A0A7Y6DHW0_9PSED|nr:restriction endonuclease subunit S [Pseudomonas corrugata]NUT88435.1 restriction endonuclease subunit S [Pseudomonas corrugata]